MIASMSRERPSGNQGHPKPFRPFQACHLSTLVTITRSRREERTTRFSHAHPSTSSVLRQAHAGAQPEKFAEPTLDVVVYADGHLYVDFMPEDYDKKYEHRTRDMLPIIPEQFKKKRRTDDRARTSFKALDEWLPKATTVVHACDLDPEGQLIGDEIFINNARVTVPILRLPFNAADDRELDRAFKNLGPNEAYRSFTTAAATRSRVDWIYGMNVSTALALSANEAGDRGSVSAGRVITPTLCMLADREKKILRHQPLAHYSIVAEIIVDDESMAGIWQRPAEATTGFDPDGLLVRPALAQQIVERVLAHRDGVLTRIENSQRTYQPTLPFSLAPLQVAAGKEFGYSVDQVRDAAQALYSRHFLISYLRPNCRYLKTEHHRLAPAILASIRANMPHLGPLIDGARHDIVSPAFNDAELDTSIAAHHGIRPLETRVDMNSLTVIERDVYDLIARNFIAQFYPPAVVVSRTFTFTFSPDVFETTVSSVREIGWRTVMGKEDRGAGILFDSLEPGTSAKIRHAAKIENHTKPPRRLHDYDLIAALNDVRRLVDDEALKAELGPDARLGTESTQTGIIQRLIENKYVHMNEKHLLFVTPRGIGIADASPEELKGLTLTTQMDRELVQIQHGGANAGKFLKEQINNVRSIARRPLPVFFDKAWKTAAATGGGGNSRTEKSFAQGGAA